MFTTIRRDNQVAILTVNKHIMDCMNTYNEIVAGLKSISINSVNVSQNPAVDRCYIQFFNEQYQNIMKKLVSENQKENVLGIADTLDLLKSNIHKDT